MGVMRFLVHPDELFKEWPEVYRAYICGFDGRVYPTRIEVERNVVACRRKASESGKLHVAWPVEGFGRPMVNTTQLSERDQPYVLAVELARGKISQVREQAAAWEQARMQLPDEFHELNRKAHRLFAKSTATQNEEDLATRIANDALQAAFEAAECLVQDYTRQRLAVRSKRSPRLPVRLECGLGRAEFDEDAAEAFTRTFTAASSPIQWKYVEPEEGRYEWDVYDAQVDWCLDQRLPATGGPLLDFSFDGLPQWLSQWSDDFFNLRSFIADFVETAISRYLGRIRTWEVAARANVGGAMDLTEEHRLGLVVRALESARQVDQDVQLMISVDQPWGEYQARGRHQLSAIQFVDALVRAGVGLSTVNLEIAVGYTPWGTASRDVLEFSRLIDLWNCLGIPLSITLAFPAKSGDDERAASGLKVNGPQWKQRWSPAAQAAWIDEYMPVLMAKQSITAIRWCHWTDEAEHFHPHAGLKNAQGAARPALDRFAALRADYWQSTGDEDSIETVILKS